MLAWRRLPQAEAVPVQWTLYTFLAVMAAVVDRAYLATWWWTPDLTVALAAWAMVDGTEDGVVWRAWLAGLACDVVDPVGGGFYMLSFTVLGMVFVHLRHFLFRTRAAAWMVSAAVIFMAVRLVDGCFGGFADVTTQKMVIGAGTTAVAAAACGWLFGGLPARWRPVGVGGA